MANTLSVKLTLDAGGYVKGLKDAGNETKAYTNQVTTITKSLPNLKKELAQATKETMGLTLAVSRLTKEQRNSAEGRAMIKMLEESKAKTAELKDMAVDTQAAIKNMASDTRGLDVLSDVAKVAGNSFSALAGTIGLVTGEEDKMKQAVVAFTTVQSTLNGLTAIQNALQKESSLMLAVSTLQQKAKTAATELDTVAQGKNIVATKSATAAQAALNLVADANPYVLLASAIIALVGGYVMFEDEINKLIGIQTEAQKTAKEISQAYIDQSKTLAETKTKVTSLQIQWSELRSEGEKLQWIKDNQDEFESLGVEINSVQDAENFLVKNTDKFIKAQELRAKALAYTAVAASKYQKAIENREQVEESELAWYEGAFTQLKQFAQGKYVQTFEQIQYSKAKGMYDDAVEAEETAAEYLKQANELNKQAADMMNEGGFKSVDKKNKTKSGGKSSTKKEEKWEYIEMKEVNFKDIIINKQTKQALQDKLNKMQNELDTKIEMYIDGQINPEYIKKLNEIQKLQEKINKPKDINSELYDEASKSIANGLKITSEAMQKMDEETKKQKDAVSDLKSAGYDALADSAYGLANVIGMVAGEEAGQAAQFAVDTAMMIANCVQQVAAMQAAAMAAGTASAAKLPFPANIAAIATIISTILAVFASLPKFAEGGIVGGSSYSGDKVLARVNSGERILTKEQGRDLDDQHQKINDLISKVNTNQDILNGRNLDNLLSKATYNNDLVTAHQNSLLNDAIDMSTLGLAASTQLYGTITVKGSDLDIALTNERKKRNKAK